jgi:hypothetical protein
MSIFPNLFLHPLLFGVGLKRRWLILAFKRQFFAEDELHVGADFWNFICQSPKGYNWVLDEYRNNAHLIVGSLEAIKKLYLR